MTAEDLLDGYDEELGGSGAQERDWKGIATALLVILMICLMIGAALVLFTPLTATSHIDPKRMNLSDVRNLRYPYVDFEFSDGSESVVVMQSMEGVEIVENGTHHPIYTRENSNEIVPSLDLKYFAFIEKSPNIGLNPNNVTISVKIMDSDTRITYDIGLKKDKSVLQTFLWNNGNRDFVFVENDKIYYQKSPESSDIVRVSNSDSNKVDGIFEWLYEEEIFGRKEALWWSEDGKYLAFTSYDDHMIRNISLKSYYKLAQYPIVTYLRYAKTFSKSLPTYTLSIWDKTAEQVKQMDVQLKDSLSYYYLFSANWVNINNAQKLVTIWANRLQNKISLTICDFESTICHLEFEYSYAPKRWAMHDDFAKIISHDNSLFLLLPHDMKDNSYQHIARIRLSTGSTRSLEFLNFGEYEVTSIVGINKENNKIYFHASAPKPYHRNLFSLSLDGEKKDAQCATCQIRNCTYSQSTLSKSYKNAVVMCKGPDTPRAVLLNLSATVENPLVINYTLNSSNYFDLVDDEAYKSKVAEVGLPVIIRDVIRIDDNYEALIKLSIPQEMYSRDKMKSIPLLVQVYGGPNDQNTKDSTHIGIEEYIATNQQIAILRIDGRGSGGRGWKYRSAVYGQLGTVEVEDQITVVKAVLLKYHMFDPSRVAVYGWSYGGFMALKMVEESSDRFFKCAVSVAPVTNFAYYDATYTERYMGDTPIESYTDVTKNLENFKTTRLLLMHGLSDDNVHFQNSAVLIEELQSKGIDFDLMIYPNQAHSIVSKINHLTGKMSSFLQRCFAV